MAGISHSKLLPLLSAIATTLITLPFISSNVYAQQNHSVAANTFYSCSRVSSSYLQPHRPAPTK
ncbi:MAG: hypothetical protein JO297_08015 [Nitrososphaeraceae archaeon]|nr:hypothetical protein [Nitrososphaeraceae archaeon]